MEIWTIDAKGGIVQLFPHEEEPDDRCKAGLPRILPGANFAFNAEPGEGREQLLIVASSVPLEPMGGRKRGGFQVFENVQEQQKWVHAQRGLRLGKVKRLAEAVIPYEVIPSP